MTKASLKEVLDLLKAVKANMRDTAEPSVSNELDRAISYLELILEEETINNDTNDKVLNILGEFLEKLPSILRLIDLISGC